jgi:hypothetical protein
VQLNTHLHLVPGMQTTYKGTRMRTSDINTVFLLDSSSFRHVLLNASRRAAYGFNAKQCSRMNRRSAHEYSLLVIAERLRNCRQQQPSYQGDIAMSISCTVLCATVY